MNTIDRTSDYAREAAGKAAQAAKALGEKGEQLLNAEQKLVKHGRSYISDHPMASVGIAVTAGFVLSRLFSER